MKIVLSDTHIDFMINFIYQPTLQLTAIMDYGTTDARSIIFPILA